MNHARDTHAFSETTTWLLGSTVSPIHTKPATTTHVTGCWRKSRSGVWPESQRATKTASKAKSMGSVGMYHPMDVSPNSLRLTERGTKNKTVDRYRSTRANPHHARSKAGGRANT